MSLIQKIEDKHLTTKKSKLVFYKFQDTPLLDTCVEEITSQLDEYPPIKIYGKICHQRRCIGFFSNKSIGYQYSGQMASSKPMTSGLTQLLKLVNKEFNAEFNGILINKYKNGSDYISAHSDDERNLDNIGVVAISYGTTRKFRIRDKKTKKVVSDVPLSHGDILHMVGNFQQEFTHEIPIEKTVKDERISFTFRKHMV